MITVDTNLLVRLATNDVPVERKAVVALLERTEALIPKTVLLETEWVLRSRYGYVIAQVVEFFEYLSAFPSVTLEDGRRCDGR
jgi:predicted nucleic acid-binding protein